jgi:hypothetical protein
MIRTHLSLPQVALLAATRGMLGAGVALLLADRLSGDQRRAVGYTLLAIGALSTIPIAAEVFANRERLPDAATHT